MPSFCVTLLVLLSLLASPQQAETHADGYEGGSVSNAVMCSTAQAGKSWVTTVVWANGSTTQHVNLRVTDRVFKGQRDFVRSARRAGMPVINRCTVRGIHVRTWTVGGAKVHTRQIPTPPPVEPTETAPLPSGPPPEVNHRWASGPPITLYSTVGVEWRVAEAVAAWNSALPSDRTIIITSEPCTGRCITVSEVPTITPPEGVDPNAIWWGMAFAHSPTPRVIEDCEATLSSVVPVSSRPHVTSHELGHCLGLPHWDFAGSVMNDGDGERWVPNGLPTTHDLAWLSSAYA